MDVALIGVLEPPGPRAAARGYLYNAPEVAHALALVARGESYRRAASRIRDHSGRVGWRLAGAGGRRRGSPTGQLVAMG